MALTQEMFEKFDRKMMWTAYSNVLQEKKSMDDLTTKVTEALSKIDGLEKRVKELEGALVVSQNANSLLKDELSKCERKRRQDNQYTRLKNVEISGIPPFVKPPDLENAVIAVAKRLVLSCHRAISQPAIACLETVPSCDLPLGRMQTLTLAPIINPSSSIRTYLQNSGL